MEKFKIEEICAKDKSKIEKVKEIEKEAFGSGAIDEWVLIPLARYGKIYSLNMDGEIVSIVEMLKTWKSDEIYIYSFATKKEFQGQGYGKKLIIEIIERLKEQKIKRVILTVAPKNSVAISLYKKLGFLEGEFLEAEYGKGVDRIKMVLEL